MHSLTLFTNLKRCQKIWDKGLIMDLFSNLIQHYPQIIKKSLIKYLYIGKKIGALIN